MSTYMNKQNVVHTYNGILFSLKKEWNSDSCYDMDETWRNYATLNEPDTTKQKQTLHDST